jgi:hypothetical protein
MRTINGIPAAVKSLFASSSIIPTIRNGKVAVVAMEATLKAEFELPVLVEPVRADVHTEEVVVVSASGLVWSRNL